MNTRLVSYFICTPYTLIELIYYTHIHSLYPHDNRDTVMFIVAFNFDISHPNAHSICRWPVPKNEPIDICDADSLDE